MAMRSVTLGLCVFLALSCSVGSFSLQVNSSIESRIVGGRPANAASIPYIVSIQKHEKHMCGGSIINARTVLTAAHCIESECPCVLKVLAGSKNLSGRDGELISVDVLHVHEKYKRSGVDYDVGLVRLSRSLRYTAAIKPIALPRDKDVLIEGTYCTIAGWGLTKPNTVKVPDALQYALVPVINQGLCQFLSDNVTPRMFCAGYLFGGMDSCQMDSGGPLVAQDRIFGIVSWGSGCAEPFKPGVYARVSSYVPWIKNILENIYMEYLLN